MPFSTDDDEEFEEVVNEMESVAATLGQGEALARSAQPVNYLPGMYFHMRWLFHSFQLILLLEFIGSHGEDDSKQAAEAMVQLSGVGFYNSQNQGNSISFSRFSSAIEAINQY